MIIRKSVHKQAAIKLQLLNKIVYTQTKLSNTHFYTYALIALFLFI